jgi:hypothetical protein
VLVHHIVIMQYEGFPIKLTYTTFSGTSVKDAAWALRHSFDEVIARAPSSAYKQSTEAYLPPYGDVRQPKRRGG